MLGRCYDDTKAKHKSYENCTVCEEWHNFQNFAKWYEENYYEIKDERMELDKDILIKGNKVYSPETCVFVPSNVNKLFVIHKEKRGGLPLGVTMCSKTGKYTSSLYINGRKIKKHFWNVIDAFKWYKQQKEQYIKQVANNYKDKIPQTLYETMVCYSVEYHD